MSAPRPCACSPRFRACCQNLASEGAGKAIALTPDFRLRKLLILLSRCPRFFDLPRRRARVCPGCAFSADVIAVNRSAVLGLQACAAARTSSLASAFAPLAPVSKEHEIPTLRRAVNLRLPGDRPPHALVQQLAAAVALLDHVECLRAHVGEFGRGELREPPPLGSLPLGQRCGEIRWLRLGTTWEQNPPNTVQNRNFRRRKKLDESTRCTF
jgi:hypothetical protein